MARQPNDDDVLDALFAAAPREFVAARKRVADELKAAGRAEEARAVARMRRPTASVWAVNQLARRAPDEIAALVALGASLRADERRVLRGGGADDFMAEARAARQKVAALARRAEALLTEAGQRPTMALARRIAGTLQASALGDDEMRAALQAGRLAHDLEPPSGFGAEVRAGDDLSSTLAASLGATKKPARRQQPAARQQEAAAREQEVAARKKESSLRRQGEAAERKRAAAALRQERRAQAAARKRAAALRRDAAAADRLVDARTRAVAQARAAVERAEGALRAAKDALADAETAAAAVHRAADEADPRD